MCETGEKERAEAKANLFVICFLGIYRAEGGSGDDDDDDDRLFGMDGDGVVVLIKVKRL